ncbi:hypothetical protein BRC93_13940 [Halobacteriales archaeon QS_5_70_15]|nr:MAG: hypothetical protein BRC93_13940 [Halobacteriales archaeon QS_5_70_15]
MRDRHTRRQLPPAPPLAGTETASPTLPADDADRLSEDLIEGTATVGAHSRNRLGIDDVNRCRGDGVTLLAEERASAYRAT